MNRHIKSFVFVMSVLLVGCTLLRHAAPLSVPSAAQVTHVTIREGSSTAERTVAEPERIRALLTFFATHNDDWHTAATTFPTPRVTVNVDDHDRLLMAVWFGPGWMGGRNGDQYASDNRLRDLSNNDRRQIETLLGINDQAEQSLAADGAIACFSSNFIPSA